MPRNVEIKVRLSSLEATEDIARRISDSGPEILSQEDVFFPCESGRLKLRILGPDRGELIFYRRPDQEGPKTSSYHITITSDPSSLRETLAAALGERAVVRKNRKVYLAGRTRIHLDRVESLGYFLELEVVLAESEGVETGMAEARELMARLDLSLTDLVSTAYIDLLEAKPQAQPPTEI